MEPKAEEIYIARTKAALEKLGIEFHFDGRFSIAVKKQGVERLVPIDLSATAPERMAGVVFQTIYAAGLDDGYDVYRRKVKDLIG